MAVNTGDERLGQWDSERTVSVPTNVGSIPDRLATIIWLVSQCQVLEGAPALRWFEANEEEFTRLREIHASYATHARSIKCLTQFLTQVIMQRDNIPITNDSRNALNVAILANNPLATALENIHNPPPTVDGLPPPPSRCLRPPHEMGAGYSTKSLRLYTPKMQRCIGVNSRLQ